MSNIVETTIALYRTYNEILKAATGERITKKVKEAYGRLLDANAIMIDRECMVSDNTVEVAIVANIHFIIRVCDALPDEAYINSVKPVKLFELLDDLICIKPYCPIKKIVREYKALNKYFIDVDLTNWDVVNMYSTLNVDNPILLAAYPIIHLSSLVTDPKFFQ